MKGILYLYVTKAKIINSKKEDLLERFQDIMKINLENSKIRLVVPDLCDENVKFITKLSNIINVEGIIIKKR